MTDVYGAMRLHREGRLAEAEALYRGFIESDPQNALSYNMLGVLLGQVGRIEDGLGMVRRSIQIDSTRAEYHTNLATLLGGFGQHVEALEALQEALRLDPAFAPAHDSVGVAMDYLGQHHHAIRAYRNAVKHDPNYFAGYLHLGIALKKQGKTDEALTALCRAQSLESARADVLRELASIAADRGDIASLISTYRDILATKDGTAFDHSNLVFSLHYDPFATASELFAEAKNWAAKHTEPYSQRKVHFNNLRDQSRKLKIGYVSPDFREHPAGRLIEPVIVGHHRDQFEVFCYSDVASSNSDRLTSHLIKSCENWREIHGMNDIAAANLIRDDGIDVLIELSGHFGGNRLTTLAHRAAPVQISHFGYCDTTGMSAIDYRFTDAVSDPPGMTDSFHVERLIRLPGSAWCYRPWDDTPDVRKPPSAYTGQITFGNLNNPVKTSDAAAAAWAEILVRVPNSRLIMLAPSGSERHMINRFVRLGAAAKQLNIITMSPRTIYLDLYNQIDIALDPFPFNGDNTTCDALWMGVPVVTLAGKTFCSRRSLSHLTNVGFPEWSTENYPQYVSLACQLAQNPTKLVMLRGQLRERLQTSPLGDAQGFVTKLEAAYRNCWAEWCSNEDS